MKHRGTGPMVALRAVKHIKVYADVEAAMIDVQGGKQTSDSAQDLGLIWWDTRYIVDWGCVLDTLWM